MTIPFNMKPIAPDYFTTCCLECDKKRRLALPFPENLTSRMIVCPLCGNKRCPKATYHDNECGKSNEPGQLGSWYAK